MVVVFFESLPKVQTNPAFPPGFKACLSGFIDLAFPIAPLKDPNNFGLWKYPKQETTHPKISSQN